MKIKIKTPVNKETRVQSGPLAFIQLRDAMSERFVDRFDVAEGFVYALLTRQHMMLVGSHGTAKSAMCGLGFSAFRQARVFATQITRMMPEDVLLGIPNIKKMQEEGVVHYNIEGMLPDADLAFIEEFFDGSDGLLRALLDVLNERQFRRGKQQVSCPLHTAIATTNFHKGDEGELKAVLDRFLVQVTVDPLEDEDDIRAMLHAVNGYTKAPDPVPVMTLNDLRVAHAAVRRIAVPKSAIDLYIDLLRETRKNLGGSLELSDRRRVWALDLARAKAYLNGHPSVQPEDLSAVKYGVVVVGRGNEAMFDTAFDKVVGTMALSAEGRKALKPLTDSVAALEAKLGEAKTEGDITQITAALRLVERTLSLFDASKYASAPEVIAHKTELEQKLVALNNQATVCFKQLIASK